MPEFLELVVSDEHPGVIARREVVTTRNGKPEGPARLRETRSFEGCALYRACAVLGTVRRTDCRKLTVCREPYAQYADALILSALKPRKRRCIGWTLTPSTGFYIAVVPLHRAPALDSLGLPESRYGTLYAVGKDCGGPGGNQWLDEFEARLVAAGAPIWMRCRFREDEPAAHDAA